MLNGGGGEVEVRRDARDAPGAFQLDEQLGRVRDRMMSAWQVLARLGGPSEV